MRKILVVLMVLFLSLILFACSQTEKFTLKFNTNGGNYIESVIVSGEQSDYSVPTPTKEGYTFVGWYTDNGFTQEWDGKISANLTIFAKWEINSYTLSYVTNCDELFDNVVLKYDDKLPSHQSPYKEGYTFVGWYLDEELTKPNDLVKMPANDVTLYAKYNANSCQIKFVVDDIAIKTIFVDYDSKITETEIPSNVEKKGHTFIGWELNGESYDFNNLVNGSLKLVAKFEVNTYKLRFNVEGVETVVEYKYGVSINPINNPEKSGHTFVGWTVLNNETGEYEEFSFSNVTMPDHDIILYAKWNINKYNIDFVLNSGIGEESIKGIEYNSTNFLPENPIRDGYQFAGWYTDSDLNTKFEDIYMPAKNLVLYAKWEANNYRVIFDGNGASGEMNSLNFIYATQQKLPSNQFVKVGHTFKGWSLEKDGEVKYLNEASVNNLTNVDEASVTLYAVWQINQYSITFEVDGKEVAVITQDYGTAVVAPEDPTKEGYTFNGWDNEIPATMPAENLTFVAHFSINKYNITFKVDGEVYHVISLNYHENITLPTEPTKEGHTFAGWDTTVPSKMPAEDLVINAQWSANTYKLTVVFDNGEDTYTKEVVYGMAPEYELPTVSKTGYTFAGWNGNVPTTMPASDVTITALWTINQYSITFDSTGGSPVDTITKDYGSNVNAPVAPTKEGNTFAGWMVLNPETGEYEEFSFIDYKLGANDVNLVAAWNINSYKLTYVHGYKENEVNESVVYASELDLNVVSREGYTFGGWFYDIQMINKVEDNAKMPANDLIIYAKWDINQYSITFDTDGGSKVDTIIKDYGSNVNAPIAPIKEGHTFGGWMVLNPETNEYEAFSFEELTMPSYNIELKAKWNANTYTLTVVYNNGEEASVENVVYGEKPSTVLVDPVKEGHTFTGWDGSLPTTMPAENVTITAQWQINSYKLTVVYNNGQEALVETVVYGEKPSTVLVAPTKEGHTFTGWDGSVPTIMPAENVTINAQWTVNTYKFTVVFDNGEDSYTKEVVYGMAPEYELPTVSKTGYTFVKWDGSVPATMPASDVTITALWTINQYSITFDSNGGSPVDTITKDYGSNVNAPVAPTKEGHTFAGWTVLNAETGKYEEFSFVDYKLGANDVDLVAAWNINSYKLTIVYNNGTLKVDTVQYKFGALVDEVPAPEYEGFSFDYWRNMTDGVEFSFENFKMPAKDIIIMAMFENIYTISFVTNSDSVIAPISGIKDQDITSLIPAIPTKDGYEFIGWTIFENDSYVPFDMPTTMPGRDITLYADWKPITYTVMLDVDGQTTSLTATFDKELLVESPTKEGHTFAGWSYKEEIYFDKVLNLSSEKDTVVRLTATWTINQYSITFNSNTGSPVDTITKDYGSNVNAPEAPTKEGHTFGGWMILNPETNEYEAFSFEELTMPSYNIELKAQWNANTYTLTVVYNNGEEALVENVVYGEKPSIVLVDPVKEGHTFTGWDGRLPTTMPAENVTITAQWQINSYKLTVVYNNGQKALVETVVYGEKPSTVLVAPTKEGHTFAGWDGSVPSKMPAENVTINAQWQINSYKLTVVFDNGEAADTKEVVYGMAPEYELPTELTKTGYTFAGWNGNVPTTMPASDVTITALWTANTYIVTFDGNGHTSGSTQEVIMTYDQAKALSTNGYSRSGYAFSGWALTADGSKAYDEKEEVSNLTEGSSIRLYAVWTPIKYTVELVNGDSVTTFETEYGKSFALNELSKIGYTFNGWKLGNTIYKDSASNLTTIESAKVTLIADFTVNIYTITFMVDNNIYHSITNEYGAIITTPKDPSKLGYRFIEWDKEIPSTIPAEDLTINAVFEIKQITITFIVDEEVYYTYTNNYGTAISAPANPSKEGYSFVKWDNTIPTELPAEDLVLTAIFDEHHYSITFNSNEGTVVTPMEVMENIAFTDEFNLPANGFRRNYYHFVGWSTVRNGVVEYTNEQLVSGLTANDDGNVVLYAVWENNTYSIVFNANGAEGAMAKQIFTCNQEQKLSINSFVKEGYRFIGWATSSAANAPVVYDDNANISENLVEANGGEYHLYAVWEAIEYNVTYVHGYKDSITVKLPYDQLINLSVEDREGYTFDAWYLDSDFSEEGKVTSITVPVDGVTLYAKWNINYHYVTINLGASHKIAATTLTSEPLYLPYNTNLSKYLSDNNYVLDRKGNTKTIKLGEEDITSGFNMYTIGDNDVVINVSYKPISYIVKFIIDDSLLFANQYTYGTALTYADVKADLKLKRDTLHELLGILRTFIISEGKQGTDAFMAFALTSDLQLSQKSLIINSLVVYNDPTYNLLVSYYNELFAQNFSHLTTLFEFVSLAEESFTRAVQSEPKLDGQIFTGWVLGSNTYYLDSIPGDPYQDAVPSGSNGVSNVVADFIDAPALELTANDFNDKTLSWETQWNAFVRDYLVEYYGYNADSSLSKVSYNVSFTIANYNSVSGRTDELGKTNDLSYTFMTETTHSIPGNYDVFVKANVNVYNKEGVEIANFETALGNTVRVSLSPEVNSGNLTSSGEYFYIFERLGVNYLYIFTNSTYSFDNKFNFGNVINYEYSYEKLISVDEVAYANGTTIITTNNLCGDFKIYAPQADNTVKEYYVRILPLVNKFTFDESLSDYKYAVNSLNDIDTYLDKEAKPYMIGNSVPGMTISEYPNNGVKLDVYTLTNTNQTIDKNLFAGYLNYIFYVKDTNGEWKMLQDAELDSFVKYNSTYDTYEFNGDYDKRYKLVVEFGEYCIPQALINFIKPIELEFVINDCINVYSHEVLQRVYANLNYQNGINIHSNIEAVLTNIDRYTEEAITGNPAFALLATVSYEEHKSMKNNKKLDYTRYFTGHIPYAEYWQTKDNIKFDGSPINMTPWELHHLYTKAYLNYKDSIQNGNVVDYYNYIATFRTGNVYMRAGVVDPNYQEQYEINGNYFEIDGSKLGYMSVNSYYNLSKIDGYLVPNTYSSFFAYYVHSNVTDYNTAMATDYEVAYAEHYVKNNSNVIFNNVTIQSNTSTTHEAGSDLTSSAIAMMNRNAGGYIGVTAGYGCGLITNNTIIRGATLGLAARWESELTMNYTTILSSWANPVYLLDAGNVNINTSYIRDSGGSAIYVEDTESVITDYEKDADGKIIGPKYEGFVTDNYINVDLYTKIENFVVGTEGYYNAYGMTTQVTGLKGQLEPVLNGLEGQKLTSIEIKENYLGQKVEMINFVYMACVAGKHGETANSKNVLPICHTKINIQSYAITQTGINVGTVTQSGATHPHFGNQMVLRNIDPQTGNFDGYLLLTYDVPGKGRSVLGLGVKPYIG